MAGEFVSSCWLVVSLRLEEWLVVVCSTMQLEEVLQARLPGVEKWVLAG